MTYRKDNPPEFYHGEYGRAIIYAQMGEPRKAIDALDRALAEHDMRMTELEIEPLFRPLDSDQAFLELEKKIGVRAGSSAVAVAAR